MKAIIFSFLMTLGCFINSISAQNGSLITALEKTLQIQIDALGEEHLDIAMYCDSLGMMYMEAGKYPRADSLFGKSLNIKVKKLGEKHPDVADSYNNIGRIHYRRGNYEKAINFHNKALNIRLKSLGKEHINVEKYYNDLGNVYYSTGDYEKAISLHNKALNIRLEVFGEKHPDVAKSYNNLGIVYRITGNYEKAISLHNKALNIRLEVLGEKHPKVATSYNNLGNVYKDMGNYEKAINLHTKALNIRLEVFRQKHTDVAMSYYNLGIVYRSMGNYEKASSFYNKALNIDLEVFGEKHPYIISSYNDLAITYEKIMNYKTADSIWHILIPQSTQRLKSTYLFLPNAQRIKYANTLTSTNTDFYSFAAFNGMESTQQLATNYLLNTKSLALDYAISTNQLIKKINDNTLTSQYQQLNKFDKQLADVEKLTIEEREEKGWDLSEIRDQQETLAFQILQHPQLKSKLNTETIEWQDIQNHLASDEATVDFLRVYENKDSLWTYYGIVIHKDLSSPQFIRIADENVLTEFLETDETTHPNYLVERYSRKALYKALWQPLVPYLKGIKTIHISPTNILYRVPFESLQDEKNEYLAAQYDFHYYSAIRDMLKEKPRKMNYKNMMLLGHILYDTDSTKIYIAEQDLYDTLFTRNTRDGIQPLKRTLEEVMEINEIGKKAKLNTTMLTIDVASEDTIQYFVGELAPNIIHFATHGVFLPPLEKKQELDSTGTRDRLRAANNPLQRSALMLYGANETWIKGRSILGSGEDGILTALEISSLDLQNTDLVVLSACSTGLGNVHNTEGVFGLQRAFKLAGVNHVVASLWDVDDEATKDLMVIFYENLLKEKQDPAIALRNAKDELREEGYEPENWAGFILIE